MKKQFRFTALVVALLLVFTACGNSGDTSNSGSQAGSGSSSQAGSTEGGAASSAAADATGKVQLGTSAPLTGAAADYGNSTTNGMKMAVEEINAQGGILGKEVVLTVQDDQSDVTQAVNAYNKLMEEGMHAFLGAITSKPSAAVAESAVEDGVPVVTPTGTQPNITEGKANAFRVAFTDPYQGKILAFFAKDHLKAKTFATMANNSSDYSVGVVEAFKAEAEKQGLVSVAEEGYGDGDTDFKTQLTTIKSAKPDVLLVPDYYEKDALIASQAKNLGLEATLLGADGWDGVLKVLDASDYPAVENAYFPNHFAIDSTEEVVKTFVDNYKKKYGEDPTSFAALGYDDVYLIKQAMEAAGSTDYQAVCQALEKVEFSGVTGSFTYDEGHNPVKSAVMMTIKDGKYVFDSVVDPNK